MAAIHCDLYRRGGGSPLQFIQLQLGAYYSVYHRISQMCPHVANWTPSSQVHRGFLITGNWCILTVYSH